MILTDKLSNIANAIRSKTGKSEEMTLDEMPVEIEGIFGNKVEKPFDCHSVTFVYGDKSYVRSVADGDTCADPVERGLIPTPTKESTAQYNYTYAGGWSAEDGGAADANILKNITEDKTVYAVFTATVRYYTITWLDSDGVTELPGQKQWAYGTVPSYTPTKSGFSFTGWDTEPVAVNGDATYTAVWEEKITFAGGSWEDIIRIVEAGEAENNFALGDTKEVINGSRTFTLRIAGFNHDDLADGSGKAGMTIISVNAVGSVTSGAKQVNADLYKDQSDIYRAANDGFYWLPDVVKNAAKSVLKKVDNSRSAIGTKELTYWVPSTTELGLDGLSNLTAKVNRPMGTQYAHTLNPDKIPSCWVRNMAWANTAYSRWAYFSSGLRGSLNSDNFTEKTYPVLFGFCL